MTTATADKLRAAKSQLAPAPLRKRAKPSTTCWSPSSPAATSCWRTCPAWGRRRSRKALARCFSGTFDGCSSRPTCCPPTSSGRRSTDPREGTFSVQGGPGLHQRAAGGRDQPRLAADAVGAARGDERAAGVDRRRTRPLPAPFLVIATQNPVEFHGTYPLPEAQLDRFGVKVNLGYPKMDHEVDVLFAQFDHHPLDAVRPVLSGDLGSPSRRPSAGSPSIARSAATWCVSPTPRAGTRRSSSAARRGARSGSSASPRPGRSSRAGVRGPRRREGEAVLSSPTASLSTRRRATPAFPGENVVRDILEAVPVPA